MRTSVVVGLLLVSGGCGPQPSADAPAPGRQQPQPDVPAQLAELKAGERAEIHLTSQPATAADFAALADASSVERLRLAEIDPTAWPELPRLVELERLRIDGPISPAAVETIAQLKSLRVLNLPQGRLDGAGLRQLAVLPDLELLRLGKSKLEADDYAALADYPSLRWVHLLDMPVPDAALDHFAALPGLESLYLDATGVSDEALSRLVRQRREVHLHVNNLHHRLDPRAGHD